MPHATEIVVTPLEHGDKQTKMGAVITGADVAHLDDAAFARIHEAVYTHAVVILKGQAHLLPAEQFAFVHRFDPAAAPRHGFGYGKTVEGFGDLGKRPLHLLPDSGGGVTLVGHGYQGDDHYGLAHLTMAGYSHADFHADPLPPAAMAAGHGRLNSFHFDGTLHGGAHPSRVTSFRCVRAPTGPDVTVELDADWQAPGHRTLVCRPGTTAFLDTAALYARLTPAERRLVDHSTWEPAPHPFAWKGTRRMRACGFGLEPGGATVPLDALPPWSPDALQRYPLAWVNPVTGTRAVQVMPECVRRLHLREGPEAPVRVVEDLEAIRVFLNGLFDRVLDPAYMLLPTVEEGDMVVWNNWGVMHSGIGYPLSYGPRSMHQCHIASSTPPLGPQDVV